MEEKSKKKVNLSTLICVIVIFVLIIALMIVCYFAFLKKDNAGTQNNATNAISENVLSNTTLNENTTLNTATNEISTNTAVAEKGQEIDLNSSEVQTIVNKFNFGFVAHSFYKVGDFTLSNIPNDLVLRVGWNRLNPGDKTQDSQTLRESVDKSTMAKSIKNIFGDNVTYQDKSFKYGDVATFSAYAIENVGYNGNKETYEATIFQGGGAPDPYVYEEVQKAVKYDDKIELYVKTAFVDIERDIERNEDNRAANVAFIDVVYSNYDFAREEFENKLSSFSEDGLDIYYDGRTQLSTKKSTAFANVIDKLDTYKYTFTLDKNSGEYYLTAFNKE